ncbi:hypothetical protein LJC59_01070 [Desulfovibrio sp. OttesenSCG-928-A18]|nr:hypothetical protein [Desulfovibrio sp. OttesenSCG-928-A18]
MSQCCNTTPLDEVIVSLKESGAILIANADKLSVFVNGGENQLVNLGGVMTPVLRNLARQMLEVYIRLASRVRLGVVRIGDGLDIDEAGLLSLAVQTGTGLVFDENGALAIDFSQMPTDKFEEMLKSIHVPIWLSKSTDWYVDMANGVDDSQNRDGLSWGRAFKTAQYALEYVASNFNLGKYAARINLSGGIYGPINLPKHSNTTGAISIIGSGKGDTVLERIGGSVVGSMPSAGSFSMSDLTLRMLASGSQSQHTTMFLNPGVALSVKNVSCQFYGSQDYVTGTKSLCRIAGGSLTINGGCDFLAQADGNQWAGSILHMNDGGVIWLGSDTEMNGITDVTLRGLSGSSFNRNATMPIISGTVTGKRYQLNEGASARTIGGGPQFFPGTIDGTASTVQYS